MMDRKWCSLTFLTSICLILFLLGSYAAYEHFRRVDAREDNEKHYVTLQVEASNATGRPIPETLFGIFFEEINHAGAGGLWAELVSNRGFEAGGQIIPSSIWPWSIIGDESTISVVTDRSSCFERNKIALRMEVFCNSSGCPSEGVGVYNPGYWGMNIEEGKKYKVTLYVRSTGDIDVSVSLTSSNGSLTLASEQIIALASEVSKWTKKEMLLEANGTDDGARLQLTTTKNGSIWFDQVSAMPVDTYKGHGFRNDLFQMMVDLKPRFIRFPGGCYVEGDSLSNAFQWKKTVGAWEERPGHFGDVWNYWTDDGLGHFEFFQLAEDLGAAPIWVFNSGISHHDQVETARIMPFVQEALDGIEFARGDANSTWGSVRAAMGHPKPFGLKYVAVGNEDCGKKYYKGNYLEFYNAIKKAYPDIKIISNCDGSSQPLDHPADYYDYHVYTLAKELFSMSHMFDKTSRDGPKAFVSEYAVNITDANTGNLLAALGEAGFLLGLEKNSDVVGMVSYAPLFVNTNDRRWLPDAIVFNSSHLYGTPSYWVQQFFTESSGATLLSSTMEGNSSYVEASAISFQSNGSDYIQIKAVNFANVTVELKVKMTGLDSSNTKASAKKKKVLTSASVMDENSFSNPEMVRLVAVPASYSFHIKMETRDKSKQGCVGLVFLKMIYLERNSLNSLLLTRRGFTIQSSWRMKGYKLVKWLGVLGNGNGDGRQRHAMEYVILFSLSPTELKKLLMEWEKHKAGDKYKKKQTAMSKMSFSGNYVVNLVNLMRKEFLTSGKRAKSRQTVMSNGLGCLEMLSPPRMAGKKASSKSLCDFVFLLHILENQIMESASPPCVFEHNDTEAVHRKSKLRCSGQNLCKLKQQEQHKFLLSGKRVKLQRESRKEKFCGKWKKRVELCFEFLPSIDHKENAEKVCHEKMIKPSSLEMSSEYEMIEKQKLETWRKEVSWMEQVMKICLDIWKAVRSSNLEEKVDFKGGGNDTYKGMRWQMHVSTNRSHGDGAELAALQLAADSFYLSCSLLERKVIESLSE